MATRKPLTLITGSPNKIQEMPAADTLDPASASLTGSFVGTTDTQTLTNKTLSSPKITGSILDANGLEAIDITATIGAVNQLVVENSVGTDPVVIRTAGDAVTGSINIAPKNGGAVQVNGSDLITASSTTTLTNKTLTAVRISELAAAHAIQGGSVSGGIIADGSGRTIIGTYGTGAGTYLTVRNNAVTGSATVTYINLYGTSSDSNVGINIRPKGTGPINIVDGTSGVTNRILDNGRAVNPLEYRTLTEPPSSGIGAGYSNGGLLVSMGGLAPIVTNRPMDVNVIFWYPFFAPRNGAASVGVSGFTICTTATHAAVGNVRVGIWTNSSSGSCYPVTLVSGSEVVQAIANTANTIYTNSSMTASLTPGEMYWMGFNFDNATTDLLRVPAAAPRLNVLGALATATANSGFYNTTLSHQITGYVAAHTYGAFPATTSGLTASMGHITTANVDDGVNTTAGNIMHQIGFST